MVVKANFLVLLFFLTLYIPIEETKLFYVLLCSNSTQDWEESGEHLGGPWWVAGVYYYRSQAQNLCSSESNNTESSHVAEVHQDGPIGVGCKRNSRLLAAFEWLLAAFFHEPLRNMFPFGTPAAVTASSYIERRCQNDVLLCGSPCSTLVSNQQCKHVHELIEKDIFSYIFQYIVSSA